MSAIDVSDLDFSQVFLNPFAVPEKKNPEDHYQEWKQYKEFLAETPEISRAKLFRYIPLVYSQKTPLNKIYDTIEKVKGAAAEIAGFFKSEDGKYHEAVEMLLTCSDPTYNAMILRYITLHKQSKYHEICVLKEAHFKLGVKVLEDPNGKDLSNFTQLGGTIDELTTSLFNNDNTENLKNDMNAYYLSDKLMLRPEDIAKKRKQGKALDK
jgi:hypothetical protein